MFKASAFKLNMFQQCPRKYKFHYIDGLNAIYRKPHSYLTMGEHVHATLKEFLSAIPTNERNISKLGDLLREKWRRNRKGFDNAEDERKWAEKALAQLSWFAKTQDLSVTPLMVEDYHQVKLATNITLAGRIDRVDQESDGSLHIIDYKTGKMPDEIDQTQLHIYALILSKEQNLPVTKASYLYLQAGEFRTREPTAADLEQANSYVMDMVDRVCMEKTYPATLNDYCGNCGFLNICPKKEEVTRFIASKGLSDY